MLIDDDETRYISRYDWTGRKIKRRRRGKQAAAGAAVALLVAVSWLVMST